MDWNANLTWKIYRRVSRVACSLHRGPPQQFALRFVCCCSHVSVCCVSACPYARVMCVSAALQWNEIAAFQSELACLVDLGPLPKKSMFGRNQIEEIAAMNKVFQKIIEKSVTLRERNGMDDGARACVSRACLCLPCSSSSPPARKSTSTHNFIEATQKMQQQSLHVPEVLMRLSDPNGYGVRDFLIFENKSVMIVGTTNNSPSLFNQEPGQTRGGKETGRAKAEREQR